MSSMSVIFVWLDQRIGTLPGGNEKLKNQFRTILTPIKQFDKPTICQDFLQEHSMKDKRVFFLTTQVFAEEDFLKQVASLPNVSFIYIYDQGNNDHVFHDQILQEKIGSQRIIHFDERLYEQLVIDLSSLYENEGEKLERGRQTKEAKQLYQSAVQLIDTIEDKDQDLQQTQMDLSARIARIK